REIGFRISSQYTQTWVAQVQPGYRPLTRGTRRARAPSPGGRNANAGEPLGPPARLYHRCSRSVRPVRAPSCLGGAGRHPERELVLLRGDVDLDLVPLGELAEEELLRERVLDVALERPLQRARPVRLVVPLADEEVGGRLGEPEGDLL